MYLFEDAYFLDASSRCGIWTVLQTHERAQLFRIVCKILYVTHVLLHAPKSNVPILLIKHAYFFPINRLTLYVLQQILQYHSKSKDRWFIFLVTMVIPTPYQKSPKDTVFCLYFVWVWFFLVFFGDTRWKLKITLFPVTLHDCVQKEWNKITEHLWEGEGYHSCIKKIKHLQLLLDPFLKFLHQSIAHLKYQKAEKSYC